MDFSHQHIVISGGTGALGTAVVGQLLALGATCHVPVFNRDEAARFAHKDDAKVHLVEDIDLSNEAQVQNFYASLPSLWASIHIAGGFDMQPLVETSKSAFEKQMTMNATTCFLCCREAVRVMKKTPDAGGRIVNVAARPALEPRTGAGMAAYTASKAAVAALSQALGEELAVDGILVNAVAPSILDTPANRSAMPDADFSVWPTPAQVAATILHLASMDNAVGRSGVIPVYGRS